MRRPPKSAPTARGESLSARAPTPLFVEPALAGASAARAFLAALGKLIGAQRGRRARASVRPPSCRRAPFSGRRHPPSPVEPPADFAPERLLLTFDNLDALAAGAGARSHRDRSFACSAHPLSRRSPAIPSHWRRRRQPERFLRGRFDKLFQLTFNAQIAGAANSARLIGRLTGGDGAPRVVRNGY